MATPSTTTRSRGFSLFEMMVVVAIISALSSIVYVAVGHSRAVSRDLERVKMLNDFRAALTFYYLDNKRYPGDTATTIGRAFHGFYYNRTDSSGTCLSEANDSDNSSRFKGDSPPGVEGLGFDNGVSRTFLKELLEKNYTMMDRWYLPLLGNNDVNDDVENIYNCRYVVPENELGNVQHYLLQCNLEVRTDLEASDGGKNDTVYEVMSPGTPWICSCGQDGKMTTSNPDATDFNSACDNTLYQ